MVEILVMKSGSIESIPLEYDETISIRWYINNCLSQVFDDVISQRREKTELCGLILHGGNARLHRISRTTEFLAVNPIESYPNASY